MRRGSAAASASFASQAAITSAAGTVCSVTKPAARTRNTSPFQKSNAIPIPGELSFEEAAAVPLVFLTAWHMLTGVAKIKPGEDVLVVGAGSGVGSAAVQIAKMFHCRVITTAGDEAKLAKAKDLGADEVIDHYQPNHQGRGPPHHRQEGG